MTYSVVIPLAGYGSRFKKSGYKTLKPFLKVDGKNSMLDLILNNFSTNSKKIFIVRKNLETKYLKILQKYKNSEILFIKPHKLGPLYTLFLARHRLQELKNIFISYCDIHWKWNKLKLANFNSNVIFCFKGWHPFTVDNNNYAFCKIKDNKFVSIKEKESFTKNWQKEPLSIGLFFFKKGKEMINVYEKAIRKKILVNKEYFPSLAFNYLKNTKINYVKNFCHIGNPNYYEIFKKWKKFKDLKNDFKGKVKKSKLADETLILAAGESKRFLKEKIKLPKFLCKTGSQNLRMVMQVKNYLPSIKKINLISYKKKQKNLVDNFNLFCLEKKTDGQASSAFKLINKFSDKKSFFINCCDNFSIFDLNKFKSFKNRSDIIVFSSENFETDNLTKDGSWIKSISNRVKKIYVKTSKIGLNKRLTGNFFFKNKKIFNKCYDSVYAKKNSNNEILIDDLAKQAIKMKYKVYTINDKIYVNMGTPKLLKEFNFWENYFDVR